MRCSIVQRIQARPRLELKNQSRFRPVGLSLSMPSPALAFTHVRTIINEVGKVLKRRHQFVEVAVVAAVNVP
jgi:hypothetical protein